MSHVFQLAPSELVRMAQMAFCERGVKKTLEMETTLNFFLIHHHLVMLSGILPEK